MKLRLEFVSALFVFAPALAFSAVEFSGYMKSATLRFVLTDIDRARSSDFLTLGQSFAGYTLVEFDSAQEILSVRAGDATFKLPLKPPRLRSGKNRFDLAAFRAFFARSGAITAEDVEARFGPPPRYTALRLEDTENAVTRDHSWWYYPLGPDENIGVQMDRGKVQGVYAHTPRQGGGFASETIRRGE